MGNKLSCPKCQKENDPGAEYCWACYFDFVPEKGNSAGRIPSPSKLKDPDIQEKFRLVRQNQKRIGISIVIALLGLGILTKSTGVPKVVESVGTIGLLIFVVIGVIRSLSICRCPACNTFLVKLHRLKFCPSCGVELQ